MTGVLMKRGNLEGDMHRGETSLKIKADTRVMLPQIKEHQRWPANHQKSGKIMDQISSSNLRRNQHLDLRSLVYRIKRQ